ncbi:MAG: hypothetical protein ABEI58_04180 [Candidatus Nanohaloarchaea archaeon]
MSKKLILALFLGVILAQGASAVSIGVVPGINDLGTVQRGETVEVNFYVKTTAREPFVLRPEYTRPSSDFFQPLKKKDRSYDFEASEASQEEISGWIDWEKEEFRVEPSTKRTVTTRTGNKLTGVQGTVTFQLTVPGDAEPGYHAGYVNLNPDLSKSGGTVQNIGLSRPTFVFRVPGEVRRELEVADVRGLRSGDSSARLDLILRNTGTVTVGVEPAEFSIFQGASKEDEINLGTIYVEPGSRKVVRREWGTGGELEAGEYRARGSLNYITGNAFFDQTFDITQFVQIQPSETGNQVNRTGGTGGASGDLPLWLVAMILVLLGVLLYSFEIDPIWIVAIVGVTAISFFILMTGLPAWLIAVLIIITFTMIYYG